MRRTRRTSRSARGPSSRSKTRSRLTRQSSRRIRTSVRRSPPTRRERAVEVLKIQNAARNSTEWFENVERYTALEAPQFAYSLLTRSQRISHENLRLRDREFVAAMEAWFARRGHAPARSPPPMFTPFTLRGLTLPNRVVVSPMAQYSCVDGTPDDYLPRASRQSRARRRRARVHRNDVRVGRRADQPGLRRDVSRRSIATRGSASSITCTRARRQRSRCSSATPVRKARRSLAGKTPTSRCRRTTGR